MEIHGILGMESHRMLEWSKLVIIGMKHVGGPGIEIEMRLGDRVDLGSRIL